MKRLLFFFLVFKIALTGNGQSITPITIPGYEFANIDAQAVDTINHFLYVSAFVSKKGEKSGKWKDAKVGVLKYDGTNWTEIGRFNDGRVITLCFFKGELYASGGFDELSDGTPVPSCCAIYNGSSWRPAEGLGNYASRTSIIISLFSTKNAIYGVNAHLTIIKGDGNTWKKFTLPGEEKKDVTIDNIVGFKGEEYAVKRYYKLVPMVTNYGDLTEFTISLSLVKLGANTETPVLLTDKKMLNIIQFQDQLFAITSDGIYQLSDGSFKRLFDIKVEKNETVYPVANYIVVKPENKKKPSRCYKVEAGPSSFVVNETQDKVVLDLGNVECKRITSSVIFKGEVYVGYFLYDSYVDYGKYKLYYKFPVP